MSPPATKLLVSAAAVAVALTGAVLPAGPAAATSPLPPTTPTTPTGPSVELVLPTTPGQLAFPADVRDYTDLGNLFRTAPMVGGDGRLTWLYSRQRTADDGRALGSVTADPAATPVPGGAQQALTFSSVPGSVALRSFGSWPWRQFTPAPMVDGATWISDTTLTPRPARSRLVQLTDRVAFGRKLPVPKGTSVSAVVPTSRGLRAVGVNGRRVVVSGPGVRDWVRDPYLRSTDAVAVAPLPDGSLLLSGTTRSKGPLPQPVLRVSPSGRISRLADRRKPGAATTTATAGLVPTKLGVAMIETGGTDQLPQANLKDAIVIRGAKGQVLARKTINAMPLGGATQLCTAGGGGARRVAALVAGPDGLPVLRIQCTRYDYDGFGSSPQQVALLVGLGEDLSPVWTRNITSVVPGYYEDCGATFVGADAKLWVLGCGGAYLTTAAPGYGSAQAGTIVSSKRDGKKGVVVRIRCRGHYGVVCSGAVRIDVGGVQTASAPYFLPARPGKAAATLDRHVPSAAPITGRFTASLEPRR